MSALFWILAVLMALLAAALVLLPLLRPGSAPADVAGDPDIERKRRALQVAREAGVLDEGEYRKKLAGLSGPSAAPIAAPGKALPVLLALLLPLGAFGLYFKLGEPRALDPQLRAPDLSAGARLARPGEAPPAATAADAPAPDMEQAVAGLAERMRSTPDDLQGWMLLGRAYKTMERFAPAKEALANAYRLAPDDPEVLVEYAESMALASDTRRIGGESLLLIQRALGIQPDNQRGLWLLGISSMQAGVPADAVTVWERLLPLVEGDARTSLQAQIDDARAAAGMAPRVADAPIAAARQAPTTPSATAVPAPTEAAAGDARLTVDVDIDPALRARMGASDVLFVYARAAEGPRMPLAIQRLPAGSLPVRVVLDDSTSMMPTLKLSLIPQVVVGARISRSGQATPQSGDFEAVSEPVSNRSTTPLSLRIDRVVP